MSAAAHHTPEGDRVARGSAVLAELAAAGVELYRVGTELRYRAAHGAYTAELRARVAARRLDVLAALGCAVTERPVWEVCYCPGEVDDPHRAGCPLYAPRRPAMHRDPIATPSLDPSDAACSDATTEVRP